MQRSVIRPITAAGIRRGSFIKAPPNPSQVAGAYVFKKCLVLIGRPSIDQERKLQRLKSPRPTYRTADPPIVSRSRLCAATPKQHSGETDTCARPCEPYAILSRSLQCHLRKTLNVCTIALFVRYCKFLAAPCGGVGHQRTQRHEVSSADGPEREAAPRDSRLLLSLRGSPPAPSAPHIPRLVFFASLRGSVHLRQTPVRHSFSGGGASFCGPPVRPSPSCVLRVPSWQRSSPPISRPP